MKSTESKINASKMDDARSMRRSQMMSGGQYLSARQGGNIDISDKFDSSVLMSPGLNEDGSSIHLLSDASKSPKKVSMFDQKQNQIDVILNKFSYERDSLDFQESQRSIKKFTQA